MTEHIDMRSPDSARNPRGRFIGAHRAYRFFDGAAGCFDPFETAARNFYKQHIKLLQNSLQQPLTM